jgi:hypothetical protein
MAARGVGPHEGGFVPNGRRHHSPGVIRRIKMCAIVALLPSFCPLAALWVTKAYRT